MLTASVFWVFMLDRSIKQPRPPKDYNKQDLETALQRIKGGMSIRKASKTYSIPRGTLQNRIHNRTKKSVNIAGRTPYLSQEEEVQIVHWINENARKGFPRRDSDVFYVVKELLDENPRETPFKGNKLGVVCKFYLIRSCKVDNMPGESWYKGFRRRHSSVRDRTPELLTSASLKMI